MPTPQENLFFVEQASCLFLTMVQDLRSIKLTSCTILNKPFLGGQDAHPTRKSIFCGTGILPVPDNGARSQIKLTSCTILNKPFTGGQDAHPTRKSILCGTGILPVPDNGARSEIDRTTTKVIADRERPREHRTRQ
jgi:hypothetical protein